MVQKMLKCAGLIFLIFIFIHPLMAQQKPPQKLETLRTLIKDKSGLTVPLPDIGWQWSDDDCKGTPQQGEMTFSDGKWLMYLIHWGPIQVKTITIDYVKKRMLTMWGVPFEFTGKEGKTTMAGHDAVYVEAYGTNRSFYTRFIVWNCLESGREFIADTNFNLVVRTPVSDFQAQWASAATLQCHQNAPIKESPGLTETYESRKYGFSFYYPEGWFIFDSPYYVPFPEYEGIRSERTGSLLGLCSDQNIRVTLRWMPMDSTEEKPPRFGVDAAALKHLNEELKSMPGTSQHQNHCSESFYIQSTRVTRLWGYCRCEIPDKEKDFNTGSGIFQAASLELKKQRKRVVIFLLTRQYMDGNVVSKPTHGYHHNVMVNLIKGILAANETKIDTQTK